MCDTCAGLEEFLFLVMAKFDPDDDKFYIGMMASNCVPTCGKTSKTPPQKLSHRGFLVIQMVLLECKIENLSTVSENEKPCQQGKS